MQWHKAKVSNLQYGLSLENPSKEGFKRRERFEIKEVGGDENTNPKHKFKS